jgi:hypothetical protein
MGASEAGFGDAVALSQNGATAIVGAWYQGAGGNAAYVFHVANEASWATTSTPMAKLTDPASLPNEWTGFGSSVAMSGDGTTALVGQSASEAGPAALYHVSIDTTWATTSTPTAQLGPSDSTTTSVALSSDGTTAFVGDTSSGDSAGSEGVYHVASESSWLSSSSPIATLTEPGAASDDTFGQSSAVSSDGTTAVIGTLGVDGYNPAGSAYVFHVANEDAWTTSSAPAAALTDSALTSGSSFGQSVAISSGGTTVLIGARNSNGLDGAADLFQVSNETAWKTRATPTETLTAAAAPSGARFGSSVALSGDASVAAAGAPGQFSTTSGSAFLYQSPEKASRISVSPNSELPRKATVVVKGVNLGDRAQLDILECDTSDTSTVPAGCDEAKLVTAAATAKGRLASTSFKVVEKFGSIDGTSVNCSIDPCVVTVIDTTNNQAEGSPVSLSFR